MAVKWWAGPFYLQANTGSIYWIDGFPRETAEVILVASPLALGSSVSAANSGSRVSTLLELQRSPNNYRRYFVTVTAYTNSLFYIAALG